jgi:hypothetical protein
MLRRAARQVNPDWAYREEKARKLQPGGLQDQDWGWVYAPTSAALFSVAWQLALVAAGLALTILSTGRDMDSFVGDLLFGCVVSAFSLLFLGSLAQAPLLVEAARRRRWGLILSGHVEVVVLLRAVEYAFGPRRVTHPHPRFVPGRLSLGPGPSSGSI